MKLSTALVMALVAFSNHAFAAENAGPVIVNKLKAIDPLVEPARQPGLFVEGAANGNTKSSPSFRAGHFLGRHFLLSASFVNLSRSEGTSGGDLESWNYVEHRYGAHSNRKFLELTYFPFPLTLKTSSPYITLAIGEAQEHVSYSYARYKPYNGAFCFGSCPTMTTEESDGGETRYTERLTSVSAGYLWHVFIGYPSLALRAGATYVSGPGDKNFTFGRVRQGTTSSFHNEELSAEVALGIDLPNWF